MRKLIFVCLAALAVSGCSDKYSCGQFPTSGCQPVSSVYNRTNDGFYDYRQTLYDEEKRRKNSRSENLHIHVAQSHRALNYATPGDPILTKPVVLRVLFNAWEDTDKDLNAGGYVYLRLRDSEWVLK